VDRSTAESALVEASRGVRCGPHPRRERGLGRELDPSPESFFLLFDLKMEHFGAVFKLELTEETRTQLQEDEVIVSSCLMYCHGFACGDISADYIGQSPIISAQNAATQMS